MGKTTDEKLVHLQGMVLAHSMALKAIVAAAIPDVETRAATGDTILSALERVYGESRVNPHGHPAFHAAASEIEDLFPSASPRAERDEPSRRE